jgi:hypothetical protein
LLLRKKNDKFTATKMSVLLPMNVNICGANLEYIMIKSINFEPNSFGSDAKAVREILAGTSTGNLPLYD